MEVLLGFLGIALVLVPIILTFVNAGRLNNLTRRLQHLEQLSIAQATTIEELRNRSVAPTPQKESEKPVPSKELSPVVAKETVESPPVVKVPLPVETHAKPIVEQQIVSSVASDTNIPVQPRQLFTPTESFIPKKSRTNKEWEALIGGKILNRIGAVALIIGMGFFLKYAFDNDWISETMRVLMGAAVGLGLLYGGNRSHKKNFNVFAQGLVGAGIATLYLSVYAAFNFYHLVPQIVAFGLMSAVTALTLLQAWKYDSLAVGLLGWAGGFLTPFMLSTGSANQIGLFTYIALLDAGLLALVLSKEKWFVIEPLSFGTTALIYGMWCSELYTPDAFVPTLFFTVLFWALFFGIEAIRTLRGAVLYIELRQVLGAALVILFFAAMYELFEPTRHAWMGLVTLLIGVPHFLMFWKLRANVETRQSDLSNHLLTSIALVFSATAIQFFGFTTVIIWSVEALAVSFIGSKWNMKSLWAAAAVMFAFSLFKLVLSDGSLSFIPLEEFTLAMNMRAFAYVALGVSLLLSSRIFSSREETLAKSFSIALAYAWCVIFFIVLSAETHDLFSRWMLYAEGKAHEFLAFKRDLTLGIVWMAYAVGLVWFGFRQNIKPAIFTSLVVFLFSLIFGGLRAGSFDPIEQYSFVFNYRVLTMALLVAGSIVYSRLWRTNVGVIKASNGVLTAVTVSIIALIFILLTGETVDSFGNLMVNASGDLLDMLSFKRVLTLALVWTAFAVALTWFGLTKKSKAVLYCGFGITVLGLGVGFFRSFWYEPVSWFVIGLNYRFFAMCLLIAGAVLQLSLWKKHGQEIEWGKTLVSFIGLTIVALALALLTSEARDFFEQKIFVVQRMIADGWTRDLEAQLQNLRNMQQLSLSGVWLFSSIVLMIIGLWKRRRNFRLVAIGLFGVTILKIFIYDLSFLETLYRIFSFMGLGVILLGVSYLYQKYKGIILDTETLPEENVSP